ncbi:hypothetical protein PQR37_10570 [Paraburkholderia nemoris]|uniref:hypothetical protein n=1 Tax=Paraburkholderia nemoris TaxID=2793076 RepID=UPI0038B7730A
MSERSGPLRLSMCALAARRAIGGRIVVRAAARPSEAVPAAPRAISKQTEKRHGPASETRLAPSGRASSEGRERMTDEARIATLWRRGTPLRELRGEYGATADAVVRTLLPALNWQRAA